MENQISDYDAIIEMAQDCKRHYESKNKKIEEEVDLSSNRILDDVPILNPKRYVDIKYLSTYIDVPVSTLRDWIRDKKIPFHKKGKLIRFDLQEIDVWMKEK